jgi:hypothetical protein
MSARDWVPMAISVAALGISIRTKWQQDTRRKANVKVSFNQATYREQFEADIELMAQSPSPERYGDSDPDAGYASVVGLRIRNSGKGEARAIKILTTGMADDGKWFVRIAKESLLPNETITPTLPFREFDGADEVWVRWADADGAQESTVKVPVKHMGVLRAIRERP